VNIPVIPRFLRIRKYLEGSQYEVPQMVMNYLLPHEHDVITVRRHPGAFIGYVSLLTCGLVAASLLTALTDSGPLAFGAVWGICFILSLWLIGIVYIWFGTYFVATEIRLILISGLASRKVITIPLREIGEIALRRSLLGRIVGYGEIVASPARPGYVIPKMYYLPYPEQLFQEVSSLIYPELAGDAAD
jgi:hypothetical protein